MDEKTEAWTVGSVLVRSETGLGREGGPPGGAGIVTMCASGGGNTTPAVRFINTAEVHVCCCANSSQTTVDYVDVTCLETPWLSKIK